MSGLKMVVPAMCGALALAACSGREDVNPVVATVDNEKITLSELQTEMKVVAAPADTSAIRTAVLDRIVTRKLMAKAARRQGLDRSPEAKTLKTIAEETVEAGLLQRATLAKAARPTTADIQRFIAEHPEKFARRTVYLVEQVRLPSRPDAALGQALAPVSTLDDVVGVLQARGVRFTRGLDEFDTLRADPRLSGQVAALKAGELFATPNGQGVSINRVRASKEVPVTGATAAKVARQLLLRERGQAALRAQADALKASAAGKITYETGYGPPAPRPES